MTHGPGTFDPPDWYIEFANLQAIAEELHCSVMDAAAADAGWRRMAKTTVLARADAQRRRALVSVEG